MTPKQKLIQEINRIIRDAYQCGFDAENVNAIDFFDGFAELEALLSTKAIGEWVPVAERLPEFDHARRWAGYTQDLEGFVSFGLYEYKDICVFYSHWLDLDMPQEVGG